MDSHSKLGAPDGLIRCPSCNRKVVLNNSNLPHFFCPACHVEIPRDKIILFDEAERIEKAKLEQARLEQACRAKAEKEEEQRKKEMRRKEEERRIQSVISALKKEIDSGNDYLGITSELRNNVEGMCSAILKRNLDDWSSNESELIRTVNSFPERQRYLALIEEDVNGSILNEMKELKALMETLVQGQDKQIGMSKDNQNAAKIGIAAHLLTGDTAGAVARGVEDAFDSDEE